PLLAFERQARRPRPLRAAPGDLLAELDALHEVGPRIEMEQRHEPAIERAGLLPAPLGGEAEERVRLARKDVREARDPADRAEENAFEDDVVEPAEEREALADEVLEIDEAARVARGFL